MYAMSEDSGAGHIFSIQTTKNCRSMSSKAVGYSAGDTTKQNGYIENQRPTET